ncbi:hypothetical protein OG473_39135 [Streptomyces anulatus]|uniref:DUF1929 domain-containing protein n=1 Tax=Streptomyces anulatus TaxID=1892 RepID=A0ABZ1ZWV2_STRAQ|nr:hypothetical protein [Streptomyces anulatus]
MTHNYDSEAYVAIEGQEIPVHATFTVNNVNKRWAGTINSEHPGFVFKLVNGQRATLRMPSGKTAPIVPAGGQRGGTSARFQGSVRHPCSPAPLCPALG